MSAVLFGVAASSFAADEKEPKIAQRKENQQKRIANGVANGSLTPEETAKIEHQESKLNKEVRTDGQANGGNLPNNQKKRVNQQQNRLSRELYRDKHNGKTQQK
jgi:hypothetical protein